MKRNTLPVAILLILFAFQGVSVAQRLTAPQLFSERSFAYLRVNDVRELKERSSQTLMGKMLNDKDLKPFVSDYYSSISQVAEGLQNAIGLSLDELLSIPNGELAVAVVPTPERPIVCFLLEAGSEMPAVEILLQRFEKHFLGDESHTKTAKKVGSIETIRLISNSEESIGYFIDSGVLVGCTNSEYVENLAQVWQGSGIDHKSLADNRDFTSILSRCVGSEGERPQISFYVNPIGIVRETIKNSPTALITATAIRSLGLEGIKAVGGSLIMAPNEFDSIIHAHLLLDNNRQAVLRAIRPKSGPTEAENWVSDSVVSYSTINWDFQATLKAVQQSVDAFTEDGYFEETAMKNASNAMGIDFRKDFLEKIDDRVSLTAIVLPDKKLNSQSTLVAIHVKDADHFNSVVLPKLFEKAQKNDSRWRESMSGNSKIYFLDLKDNNSKMRVPQPSFAMLGKCMLLSESKQAIENALEVFQSGENLLADSIEFKLIRDKIKSQLNGMESSIMTYQRADEQLKLFYDLANDPKNLDQLEESSQNNPLLMALVHALRARKLPPFETIAKYISPTGAFVTDEENGFHYTAFALKRE